MGLQTYSLELKFAAEDDQRHEALRQIFLQYGRDILASAMLLQERAAPQVAVKMTDAFYTTEELQLIDPSATIYTPDDAHSSDAGDQ